MASDTRDRIALLVGSWFGCGYSPAGPGTVGAAAAVGIAWLVHRFTGAEPLVFGACAAALTVPAVWSADRIELILRRTDPGMVVVDEVVGQWVAIAGAYRLNWKSWIAAFVLFRVFDIWKPFPVRRFERLPGGTGIVADDVMAGLYAALVLLLTGWCNLY
jgi:phosphatidylglycerophosphatase A